MRTLIAHSALIGVVLIMAPAAIAAPGSGPTALVSLGDSYISGEGGRFQGNSNDPFGSRNGTDRAYVKTLFGGYYDVTRVYLGGSDANGCNRSDTALIRSAVLPVQERINLACSGAETPDILNRVFKGEQPQADQLAAVAAAKNVKLIALSIGGNDLGFANIISACIAAWTTSSAISPHYCQDEQQAAVDAAMAETLDRIQQVHARI